MGLVLVICIIIIFVLYNKKSNLENENKRLKKELREHKAIIEALEKRFNVHASISSNRNTSTTATTNANVYKNDEATQKTNSISEPQVSKVTEEDPEVKAERLRQERIKLEAEERSKKNTTILVTGAILIVLAAIAFLLSTWGAIPDIIKTAIIVMLSVVFLGGSKLAKEKYDLDKTSKTFFYIGMAYIPICLVSISIFGLLGPYLSIYGDGAAIYLTLSTAMTAIIYLYYYRIKQDKILFYGSILAQIAAVILFTTIIETRIDLITFGILAYDILLIIYGFYNREEKVIELKNIVQLIAFLGTCFTVFTLVNITIFTYASLILLIVLYGMLYALVNDQLAYVYILNGVLYLVGCLFIKREMSDLDTTVKSILLMFYTLFAYVAGNTVLRKSENKKASLLFAIITTGCLYIDSIPQFNGYITCMFGVIEIVLLGIAYLTGSKTIKDVCGFLIPINIYFIVQPILYQYKAAVSAYFISAAVILIVGEVIVRQILKDERFESLKLGTIVVTNFMLVITYMVVVFADTISGEEKLIYNLLILAYYIYAAIRYRKLNVFKYLSYIAGTAALRRTMVLVGAEEDVLDLVPVIACFIVAFAEYNVKGIKDSLSLPFIMVSSTLTFALGCVNNKEIGLVLNFILAGYLIFENVRNEENPLIRIIPELALIGIIHSSSANNSFKLIIELASIFLLTIVTVKERKVTFDTLFTAIIIMICFDSIGNIYINCLIMLAWAMFTSYFVDDGIGKDLLKTCCYISVGVMYSNFVEDVIKTELISIRAIGLVTLVMFYERFILRKYIKGLDGDTVEYMIFGFIYLYLAFNYTSFIDGIIFSLYLIAIIMISYARGYGAIFMISIAAIVFNGIGLTRSFWSAIPKPLYILALGAILVAFATKNEMNEKTNKQKITDKIRSIKSNVDKNGLE